MAKSLNPVHDKTCDQFCNPELQLGPVVGPDNEVQGWGAYYVHDTYPDSEGNRGAWFQLIHEALTRQEVVDWLSSQNLLKEVA